MTDRLTAGQLRDLAFLSANPYQARKFDEEAARREAEGADPMPGVLEVMRRGIAEMPAAPPPPAPFVTDHKWLDPECHASGCQTLILKAEIEKLRDQRDKYVWQVRDTCRRAEAAEAREKRLREAIERYLTAKHDLRQASKQDEHEPYRAACVEHHKAEQGLSAALAQGGNDRLRDDNATARTADQMPGVTKLLGGEK